MTPEERMDIVHAQSTFAPAWTGLISADISDRAFRTYLALHSYVRPGHATFPKVSTVAEKFGLSESYIRRGIAELKDHGLIVITKESFAGGFRKVNRYYFPTIPDDFGKSDRVGPVSSDMPGAVTPDTSVRVTGAMPIEGEEAEVEEVEVERAVAVAPAPARKRASRLPEGWMPDRKVIEQMRAECPQVNLEAEHRKFSDHWAAASGRTATKADWNAAWRNWIRRAAEHDQRSNTYTPSWQKRLDANVQAAQADMNRDRGIFEIGE